MFLLSRLRVLPATVLDSGHMQKTTVYTFEYFDRTTGKWLIAPDMATEKAIEAMGAKIVRESALDVDATRVAYAGILMRDTTDRGP